MHESWAHQSQLDGLDSVAHSERHRHYTLARVRPRRGSGRKVSKIVSMNVCVAPDVKKRAADKTYAFCPDPTPTCNVSYHRDASLRLLQPWSCRHLKSLWFVLVDGRSSSIPSCASVAVVNGPKFNLDMIVHSFTSRFSETTAQHPTTCVLPHTDCVCQRTWSTMPTTCWFGLHTAPMSEDFICH